MSQPGSQPPISQRREVLRLAVPAFLALVAEPLFLLTDTAIVGHLGTVPLAGLGVASAVLLTMANVFVFLAYGTTAVVARHLGAGNRAGAIGAGIDGTWLATGLGVLTAILVAILARPMASAFGASAEVIDQAVAYLRVAAFGLPGMLIVLAATGVLRGLQDTRTPLLASLCGFGSNIVLNLLFVYQFGWGISGSAWGTVLAQTGMATALVLVLTRIARREKVTLRAHPGRILRAARDGVPLLVRTLALRAILLLTTWTAAGLGDVPLAAYQVSATVFTFLAFALDAIAIAAQAITGKSLGAGDTAHTREVTGLMVRWGVWSGAAVGLLVLALHTVLPSLFTTDPELRKVIAAALIVVALIQPLAGYNFVVDGVLIGAGDGRWLARAMVACLLAYLPIALGINAIGDWLLRGSAVGDGPESAVTWLWLGFTAFMAVRGALMWARVRTDRWMVTGA